MAVAATSNALHSFDTRPIRPGITCDDSRRDVLVVEWCGAVEARHVLELMRWVDGHMESAQHAGRKLSIVVDGTRATVPSPLVQAMLVDWLLDTPPERRAVNSCTYVVSRNPLVRGVVAALRWRTNRSGRIEFADDLARGIAAAEERLAAR